MTNTKLNQIISKNPSMSQIDQAINETDQYQTHQSFVKLGIKCLLLFVSVFMCWAAFAPLDEGIPVSGSVSIESSRKVVQHLTGGLVKAIFVKEGQEVHVGDELFLLDTVNLTAKYNEINQHYLSFRAQEDRLIAEKNKQSSIHFHDDLIDQSKQTLVQQLMTNQSQLLKSRSAALLAQVNAKQEFIAGQKAIIEGGRGQLSSIQAQLDLYDTQLVGMRELVNDGFMAKNQKYEMEQRIAQLQGQKATVQSGIIQSQKQISEAVQQIALLQQTQNKDIDSELEQVRLYIQSDIEKKKSLRDELAKASILSPASGQVVGLQVHTIGAVIQPGQKLLDIVPEGEPYIIEAHIQPNLIDKVHAEQLADIRFSSFSNTPQLMVEGKVKTVSKDLLMQTDASGMQQAYYLARIAVTPNGLKALGDHTLQPGMPVELVIKTGERTLLNYWLHPFIKRISASMKEE